MKLLVVDDNAFILDIIQRMLTEEGHEIHTENCVDDAISYLESDKSTDLVITDIVMPDKDGTRLAEFVKDREPSLPVVAITGGLENALDDYVLMAEMYADAVLQKPLKKESLIETINKFAA